MTKRERKYHFYHKIQRRIRFYKRKFAERPKPVCRITQLDPYTQLITYR